MSNQTLFPLLKSVIKDNETFKFPVESINKELTNMFLEPLEFDYFMMQSYRKIKKEYGSVVAHIFLQHLEIKMKVRERHIYNLSVPEYQSQMEEYLNSLDRLYITTIPKKSSDGEMLSAMI